MGELLKRRTDKTKVGWFFDKKKIVLNPDRTLSWISFSYENCDKRYAIKFAATAEIYISLSLSIFISISISMKSWHMENERPIEKGS